MGPGRGGYGAIGVALGGPSSGGGPPPSEILITL